MSSELANSSDVDKRPSEPDSEQNLTKLSNGHKVQVSSKFLALRLEKDKYSSFVQLLKFIFKERDFVCCDDSRDTFKLSQRVSKTLFCILKFSI